MSLDLYQADIAERVSALPPVSTVEPGAFDGFFRGTGMLAMQGLAKTARAASMAASVFPVMGDERTGQITGQPGITTTQDRYFKFHDEVFQGAVDYWTPKSNEVGVAGQVVGQLVGMIPQVIASPALTVASMQLSMGEDLVREGVSPGKAGAVGAAQGVGLGLGIWMPILGQNLWQRTLLGGAGFNVVQGVGTRAASQAILGDDKAAQKFGAFDGEALTLDVLLGLAFGGIAHISPAQRAQGAEVWGKLKGWAENLQPSEVAAIATLREAQHLNVDSLPGKPAEAIDIENHVTRMRTAIDQVLRGEDVNVSDLPPATVKRDAAAARADTTNMRVLLTEGEAVRVEEGFDPDQRIARAVDPAALISEPKGLPAPADGSVPPPPLGAGGEAPGGTRAAETAAPDYIATEAQRFATEYPDVKVRTGTDEAGAPVYKTPSEILATAKADADLARSDIALLETAATCLLGVV